jgi:adenine phosphoribosyltransferase
MDFKKYVADIENYPIEGVLFRDITPLMSNGQAFKMAVDEMIAYAKEKGANVVVGPEARGFLFGTPVAYGLECGFVPIRKPGKLPRETVSYKYDLEYGSNELFMHKDAIKEGDKVVIIDDLLATGGTIEATAKLIEESKGEVVGICFLIELEDLKGIEKLANYDVKAIIKY